MTHRGCEFCVEFQEHRTSRYHSTYGAAAPSRLLRVGDFRVFPTLGQIFTGSLLVAPATHIERFSDTGPNMSREARLALDLALSAASGFGQPIVFEHGARCVTGAGCGIYHAHIHVVPTPTNVAAEQVLADGRPQISLEAAWSAHSASDEYLVVQDSLGTVRSLEVTPTNRFRYPSQYFRRSLAQLFARPQHWDWRRYEKIEPAVITTIDALRNVATIADLARA